MKKLMFIIIFLTNGIYLYSQPFRLGIRADILTGNKYLSWEGGPSLTLDYSLKDISISLQGSTRLYLAELNSSKFSAGFTYSDLSFGFSVNYYPIHWAIEPYIGLGIFYNINNLIQSGNSSPFYNGTFIYPSDVKNNFSEEITLGIDFSANTPINFIVEITHTFNIPGKLITFDSINEKIIKEGKLNFNSLFLRIGLSFTI